MAQADIYKIVTDRILDLLEAGVNPWRKPWNSTPAQSIHGHVYRGFNAFILNISPYSSPYWMTYKEAKKRGGYIKKGEKATPIIFWKWIKVTDKETKEEKKIPLVRYYRVFNLDQTEGIENAPENPSHVLTDFQKIEKAEEIISEYLDSDNAPTLNLGGNRACYNPKEDLVKIPEKETFNRETAYYSVVFHELAHSTGHETRLNRKGVTDLSSFASHSYTKEELVAEMTAAFLNSVCEIESEEENNVAYLQTWLKKLKSDPKMIVQAAQAAQKAADLIQGIENPYSKESDTEDTESKEKETVAV